MSVIDLVDRFKALNSLVFIDHYVVERELRLLDGFTLNDNVFVSEVSGVPTLLQISGRQWNRWPNLPLKKYASNNWLFMTMASTLLNAASEAWSVSIEEILPTDDDKDFPEVPVGEYQGKQICVRGFQFFKPGFKPN